MDVQSQARLGLKPHARKIAGIDPVVLDYWKAVLVTRNIDEISKASPRGTIWADRIDNGNLRRAFKSYAQGLEEFLAHLRKLKQDRDEEKPQPAQRTTSDAVLAGEERTSRNGLAGLKEKLKKRPPRSYSEEETSYPVWLLLSLNQPSRRVPTGFTKNDEDRADNGTNEEKQYYPPVDTIVAVPALIYDDGRLSPPKISPGSGETVFVPRRYLTPQPQPGQDGLPAGIGSDATWARVARNIAYDGNWSTYLRSIWTALGHMAEAEPITKDTCFAHFVPRQPAYATRAIYQTVEGLGGSLSRSPVINQILGSGGSTLQIDRTWLPKKPERIHTAMVGNFKSGAEQVFPLNAEQRRAVLCSQLLSSGGILAVSGPPGTGKTAMLRAAIASRWVSAALNNHECPVTLCCGATNQSVENVLSTFDDALKPFDPSRSDPASRWLDFRPGGDDRPAWHLPQLAVIAPSRKRLPDFIKKYAVIYRDRDGRLKCDGLISNLNQFSNDEIRSVAERWLATFARSELVAAASRTSNPHPLFSRPLTLPSSADPSARLARKLKESVATLRGRLSAAIAETRTLSGELAIAIVESEAAFDAVIIRYLNVSGRDREADEIFKKIAKIRLKCRSGKTESGYLIEAVLDILRRPEAFYIALHIWEVRWLIDILSATSGTCPGTRMDDVRRLSMLFPCVVATLHSAPTLFNARHRTEKGYVTSSPFGEIDVVVIDEAGQASPELAMGALALASRAIVVGDLKQLAPVSQFTIQDDDRLAKDHAATAPITVWRKRGAMASDGSVMRLAATSASFREADSLAGRPRNGLLLREHYRCVRPIISLCVDLIYHDHDLDVAGNVIDWELEPPEEDAASDDFPLPPVGYFMSGSANDEPKRTDSWLNKGEANALVEWLQSEWPSLRKWMAEKQGRPEEEILLKDVVAVISPFTGQIRYLKRRLKEVFGDQTLDMKIGTVHTLQGGEKPLVLFSAVNGAMAIGRNGEPIAPFIDRDGGRLLNVAISRAQKSFILFGHADLFFAKRSLAARGIDVLPSHVVGQYMAGIEDQIRHRRTLIKRPGAVRVGPDILYIVESPHKARMLQDILPCRIQVFATGGHIRDLEDLKLTPETAFSPTWKLRADKHYNDTGTEIANLLDRAGSRLLNLPVLAVGTDPDMQGELIAWHTLTLLARHTFMPTVSRIVRSSFSAPTKAEVLSALSNPFSEAGPDAPCNCLNGNLVAAGMALRIIDGAIGYWWKHNHREHLGRVSAPLVRLLGGSIDETTQPWAGQLSLTVTDGAGKATRIPARLVEGHAGNYRPRRFKTLRGTANVLRQIDGAAIDPQSFRLLGSTTESLPPPTGLGTGETILLAMQRLRLSPNRIVATLQALYEGRNGIRESHDDVQTATDIDCLPQSLTPPDRIVAMARRIKDISPFISGITFAAYVERIVGDVADGRLTYRDAIRWISSILWNDSTPEVADFAGRCGRKDWQPQPIPGFAATGSRKDRTQRPLDFLEALSKEAMINISSETALRIETARMRGAAMTHPPLAPVDPAAKEATPAFDTHYHDLPHAREIYRLIRERSAAARRCKPASISRELLLADTPLPNYHVLVEATEVIGLGWLAVDPEGDLDWPFAARRSDLIPGPGQAFTIRIESGAPYPAALTDGTPASLLRFMLQNGLGRPRTFAGHLTKALGALR
jgi:DNA topoisomerase IA